MYFTRCCILSVPHYVSSHIFSRPAFVRPHLGSLDASLVLSRFFLVLNLDARRRTSSPTIVQFWELSGYLRVRRYTRIPAKVTTRDISAGT